MRPPLPMAVPLSVHWICESRLPSCESNADAASERDVGAGKDAPLSGLLMETLGAVLTGGGGGGGPGELPGRSYAPMSYAGPCGLETPTRSIVTSDIASPASTA